MKKRSHFYNLINFKPLLTKEVKNEWCALPYACILKIEGAKRCKSTFPSSPIHMMHSIPHNLNMRLESGQHSYSSPRTVRLHVIIIIITNLQLATSRLHVCSSKGKSARYMPQEQIRETLQHGLITNITNITGNGTNDSDNGSNALENNC